jgi:hypothetical protein
LASPLLIKQLLDNMTLYRQYDIVCAATVIHDIKTQKNVILIINQAAYIPEPSQVESLLHADQARHHHVIVNDIAECYFDSYGKPGRQSIEIDNDIISLKHDGLKYFLHIRPPTEQDWETCPIIKLTSPESWHQALHSRRTRKITDLPLRVIKEWSSRLGNLNLEATRHTLAATTQIVSSTKAEHRMTPHRHFKCRLPSLRPRRLTEGFSTDTFFASTRSARGNTCMQVFLGV